jgi:hypothetical protein
VSANFNLTRKVIRGNPRQEKNKRARKLSGPSNRCEKPINLLQQWRLLHVAPSITSSLNREFYQTQMTDDVVENI